MENTQSENTTTFDDVLQTLNEAVSRDREAVAKLLEQRVPCNAALAAHPSIQVQGTDDKFEVGALGLLNGVLEPIFNKRVAAAFNDENQFVEFIEYAFPRPPEES